MPHKDPEKRREYSRRYRIANHQKALDYEKQYRNNNREKIREKIRSWKKSHTEKVKIHNQAYYLKNRERINERIRNYVINNRSKVNERHRRWNSKNPEKVTKKHMQWERTHPESAMKNKQEWAKENPTKIRTSHLKRHFGITEEEYQELLKKQGGVCAICGSPPTKKSLYVDHDHGTGVIRGLLCGKCNSGIGLLKDSMNLVEKALNYLKRSQNENNQSLHLP